MSQDKLLSSERFNGPVAPQVSGEGPRCRLPFRPHQNHWPKSSLETRPKPQEIVSLRLPQTATRPFVGSAARTERTPPPTPGSSNSKIHSRLKEGCAPQGRKAGDPLAAETETLLGDKTYIHVGHGLIEYTVVTKFAKAVLLARVILVGLQKVFKDTLFLHGLTNTLHLLQGDPVEGWVSGPGPVSFFFPNFLLPYLSQCLLALPVCPSLCQSALTHAHRISVSSSLILHFFLAFFPFIFFFPFPPSLKLLLNTCSKIQILINFNYIHAHPT